MSSNSECWVRRFSFSSAWESSAPFHIGSWTSRFVLPLCFNLMIFVFPAETISKPLWIGFYGHAIHKAALCQHLLPSESLCVGFCAVHSYQKAPRRTHTYTVCSFIGQESTFLLQIPALHWPCCNYSGGWGMTALLRAQKPCFGIRLVTSWSIHVCERLSKLSNRKSPSSGSRLLLNHVPCTPLEADWENSARQWANNCCHMNNASAGKNGMSHSWLLPERHVVILNYNMITRVY